jgi:hypothetical protein
MTKIILVAKISHARVARLALLLWPSDAMKAN